MTSFYPFPRGIASTFSRTISRPISRQRPFGKKTTIWSKKPGGDGGNERKAEKQSCAAEVVLYPIAAGHHATGAEGDGCMPGVPGLCLPAVLWTACRCAGALCPVAAGVGRRQSPGTVLSVGGSGGISDHAALFSGAANDKHRHSRLCVLLHIRLSLGSPDEAGSGVSWQVL